MRLLGWLNHGPESLTKYCIPCRCIPSEGRLGDSSKLLRFGSQSIGCRQKGHLSAEMDRGCKWHGEDNLIFLFVGYDLHLVLSIISLRPSSPLYCTPNPASYGSFAWSPLETVREENYASYASRRKGHLPALRH